MRIGGGNSFTPRYLVLTIIGPSDLGCGPRRMHSALSEILLPFLFPVSRYKVFSSVPFLVAPRLWSNPHTMVNFLCYVCCLFEPNEFFAGLTLSFSNTPHLAQLKRDIEERVLTDGVLPDGSEFAVADIEILDLRYNMWVPLESRAQMYSGCHLTAIRDTLTGTCAGRVDAAHRRPDQHMRAFAMEAQQMYESLDVDNSGQLTLKTMLRALRHDVNYAVELFSELDQRAAGHITFVDFMTWVNNMDQATLRELQRRIIHGGRPAANDADAATTMGEGGSYYSGLSVPIDHMSMLPSASSSRYLHHVGGQPMPDATSPSSVRAAEGSPDDRRNAPFSPAEGSRGAHAGAAQQQPPPSDDVARRVITLLQSSMKQKRRPNDSAPSEATSTSAASPSVAASASHAPSSPVSQKLLRAVTKARAAIK